MLIHKVKSCGPTAVGFAVLPISLDMQCTEV